jgi:phage tail-like protein
MPVARPDPYPNFNFTVDFGGGAVAGFSEVELPEGSIEVVAYREGSDKTSGARLLPGRVDYGPLVLRRGFAGNTDLYDWWRSLTQGNLDRRDVRVTLLDETRQPAARWRIRRAWPSKYSSSDLNALGNEVVIETLELTHEGIELV